MCIYREKDSGQSKTHDAIWLWSIDEQLYGRRVRRLNLVYAPYHDARPLRH
jgi:hypothetical protein